MDLKFETEGTFLNDDKSWLAAREGIDDARSITLDLSTFTAVGFYPNGFIPSGTVLARITATGLYVPFADGAVGTGAEIPRGLLLSAVEVRATNVTGKAAGALFWRGSVKLSRLPVLPFGGGGTPGGLQTNGQAELATATATGGGQIRFDA
jgi:hypothetical protein